MATAVEVYAGNFFTIIGAKRIARFCEVCNKHYKRTAFYKDLKRNILFAALYKTISNKNYIINEVGTKKVRYENVWCV